jgi:hypothetical protein
MWVEITKNEHQHGGIGWEFGACLWNPVRNESGNDSYRIMREPAPGDEVFHFYEHKWPDRVLELRFCGWSRVVAKAEVRESPPVPGDWAGRSDYYRIDLKDFTWARKPVGISRFLKDYAEALKPDLLNKPKFYPFYEYGKGGPLRLVQGGYLTRSTPLLRQMLFWAVEEIPPDEGAPDGPPDDDFA